MNVNFLQLLLFDKFRQSPQIAAQKAFPASGHADVIEALGLEQQAPVLSISLKYDKKYDCAPADFFLPTRSSHY